MGMKLLIGSGAIFLIAAIAHSAATVPATASPADLIAGRQAAFRLSAATFGGLKGAIARGDDVKTLGFPASGLARWAAAIPGMFPAGTDGAPTHALPTVWSDRAGFEAAAANYAAAAGKMVAAAKAGDQPGFAAAYEETGKACGACHDKYRQPDKH